MCTQIYEYFWIFERFEMIEVEIWRFQINNSLKDTEWHLQMHAGISIIWKKWNPKIIIYEIKDISFNFLVAFYFLLLVDKN